MERDAVKRQQNGNLKVFIDIWDGRSAAKWDDIIKVTGVERLTQDRGERHTLREALHPAVDDDDIKLLSV